MRDWLYGRTGAAAIPGTGTAGFIAVAFKVAAKWPVAILETGGAIRVRRAVFASKGGRGAFAGAELFTVGTGRPGAPSAVNGRGLGV